MKSKHSILSVFLVGLISFSAHASWVNVPDSQVVREISKGPLSPLPTHLNLMTWNMQKGEGKARWQVDLQLLSQQKNLILLQEGAESPAVTSTLRSVLSLNWLMARSFFLETDHNATGVITGSAQEAFSSTFLRSPDREPFSETPKMSLLSTYQLQDGSRLLVVNVHAINFTTLDPFQRQMDQVVGLIRGWTGKIILAGDFNTWSPGRTFYLQSLAQSAGLAEAQFDEDPRHLILDHIFTRGCVFKNSKVHSEIDSSDHFPLTTEILCDN